MFSRLIPLSRSALRILIAPTGEGGLVVHESAGVALLVDELFVLEALEYPIDEVGVDVGGAEFLLEISPTGFASSAVGTGTTIE